LFSLRWKLGSALLLVVLISVGLMAYLTNRNTTTQFQQYVQSGSAAYTQRVVNNLEQYYTQRQDWSGVQEILMVSLRTSSDRLVLADNTGKIVGDTANKLVGETSISLGLTNGNLLQISDQTIGMLYLTLSSAGMGKGYMGGRSMVGSSNSTSNDSSLTPDGDFLNRVNSYFWIAGIIAIVVALLLGVFLTRQITRPIMALNTGANKISDGDLDYRVKVSSKDEIGELANSFNAMAKKLDNSEQSRRRMVSDVAHELRTPLTIIQGTVDSITDGVFQPDNEHLGSIREQTVLLTHLVKDLGDISLAESGQLKLERVPTDLVDLVKRKLSQFEVNAQQKNIRLIFESEPKIPPINVDAKRIEQVIGNLLSNAIRHTPEEGQIVVSLKTTEANSRSENKSLIVSVSDTGEGIHAEHLAHIFERFYRVENSRSRSEGGTGLGLAIVKQMVQAHNGQVWVESAQGKGSTFYFSLPYAE
jgi:two-component system, OmpR family, sensor histidine kinase BaeS